MKFLQGVCKIVENPEEAEVFFTEYDCWIAIWPKPNNGERRAKLYISPHATEFAYENRRGFIWGRWEELQEELAGKKAFDLNIPVSRKKPFSNDFLPASISKTFEAERIPVFVSA
ncbi:MAG: hypothetical protein PHW72_01880 [Candidatus Pacebacteria bacterium]|nr:hypothetical protein [Candidatus Paceibacterota bacterium]